MIHKHLLFFFIGLLFFGLGDPSAQAAQAELLWMTGKVRGMQGPRFFELAQGLKLNSGQVLETEMDAIVVFKLPDGSEFKLNPSSRVLLTDLQGEWSLNLQQGAIYAAVPKSASKSKKKLKIQTRTAVVSVRGTEFFVSLGKDREGLPDVWVSVREGEVEVSHLLHEEKVIVKQGLGVLVAPQVGQVEKDTAITPPRIYQWAQNLSWNRDPQNGSLGSEVTFGTSYEKDLLNYDYD